MKPIYRCEYCDKMGVEEEIMKHEETCLFNYTRKSCSTCKFKETKGFNYKCANGKDIPEGQMYVGCDKYEWDEIDHTHLNPTAFNSLFGGIFG